MAFHKLLLIVSEIHERPVAYLGSYTVSDFCVEGESCSLGDGFSPVRSKLTLLRRNRSS
jgi:hypothetical protein